MKIAEKYDRTILTIFVSINFSLFLYILLFLLGMNKISRILMFNFVFKGADYIEKTQVGAFKTQTHANVQF